MSPVLGFKGNVTLTYSVISLRQYILYIHCGFKRDSEIAYSSILHIGP